MARKNMKLLLFLCCSTVLPCLLQAVSRPKGLRLGGESDKSANCYTNNGQDYRGSVSVSRGRQRCLNWSSVVPISLPDRAQGLGHHNLCRNPDNSSMPWCYVRGRGHPTKKPCDIPICDPTALSSCGKHSLRRHKIVGGSLTSVQSQPWIAAIFEEKTVSRFVCGGSLISPCWVLTAAHCFPNGKRTNPGQLSVFLGKNAINQTNYRTEQSFRVERVITHQDFNHNLANYNNDIALLKIKGFNGQCAKQTEFVRTICLPPAQQMLPAGSSCYVVGYGLESYTSWEYSQYLKEAEVNLLEQDLCQTTPYYGKMVTENMFCAGSPTWSADSCKGDSGGPLVCRVEERMFLFGIVSWGDKCSQKYKPGVYTRVTKYNRWIGDATGLRAVASGSMYPEK